ncbi:MAG: N-formylglutamate amidohydrolase [Sphingomonadaceae bacterium]
MTDPWQLIPGDPKSEWMIIADHASNHVPPEIDLGIDPALLNTHIAIDLGVAELAAAICAADHVPAILGGVSRLVVDLNRDPDDCALIPITSDGHDIPGNRIDDSERRRRIARYWQPYHDYVHHAATAGLLVSLHSFTPQLATRPDEERPWEIGILYNQDDRAARIAIPLLKAAGVVVGDQLPYSGKQLNASMNRHGEAKGIPYLGIEVRQDLISDPLSVLAWADRLIPAIRACADHFEDVTR